MIKGKVTSAKVRMYRHGFGDCFLISLFAKTKRVCSILIDCGIKHNTKSDTVPIADVIDDLKKTLTPAKGKKPVIDVLVATHEHWDHISFFHPKAGDLFAAFDIRQIWLAWTEDPDDKEAVMINSRLREGAAALQMAVATLHGTNDTQVNQFQGMYFGGKLERARKEYNTALSNVLGFYGIDTAGANTAMQALAVAAKKKNPVSESGIKYRKKPTVSVATEEAMKNIIELGQKGGIKYFNPGVKIDSRLLPEGVNGFVLGPPRSSLLNKSNPSSGAAHETYFGLGAAGMAGFIDGVQQMFGVGGPSSGLVPGAPFGNGEGQPVANAVNDPYYQETYLNAEESYRKIDHAWLDAVGQFSLQLDGAINNTSLVLAFELEDSGKVLLFAGDAQVGSWLSWHDHKWKVKRGDKTETINAEDLLKHTVLYKVGHHGSHNATVKEKGLELMTHPDLVAMIPEKEDSYNGILYQPLMDRLQTLCKGRVLVSADVNHPPENLTKKRPAELSSKEWERFKKDLVVKPHYVEYTIHQAAQD